MNEEITTRPVKRVELVLHQNIVEDIAKKLDEIGTTGYTVIPDVLGRGERGLRSGIGLGALQYNYFLLSCDASETEKIVDIVRPYLKRYGGMCLVSDAQWVIHGSINRQ